MSQTHYRGITLEQLVERSDLVLIVKASRPARRQIQVPIGGGPKPAPAFVRVLSRCDVLGALSRDGAELVGTTLEIDGAHWQQSLSMHKSYYLQGLSKSPIYERYQPAEPLAAPDADAAPEGTPFLVFLRRGDRDGATGFAFTVDGATEHLGRRAAVEALLAARVR